MRYYPATVNSAAEAELALRGRPGGRACRPSVAPRPAFTSEDFAFLLRERPGAYLWLGQGRADPGPDGERALHHPCYDFNDDALPLGVRWFCAVAERALDPARVSRRRRIGVTGGSQAASDFGSAAAKRAIENASIGVDVAPVASSSAIVSPTPGLIAKPSPLKPNA